MRQIFVTLGALGALGLIACSSPAPQPGGSPASAPAAQAPPAEPAAAPVTDEDMITSAMSAAPEAIAREATIMTFDDKGQMKHLREGSNGWTCMPDMPTSPGPDSMCLDANGMEWAGAWLSHKDPPAGKMGFGYMLVGGSDASNTDPFASTPAAGESWVTTGPHVMIFNIGDRYTGYPTTAADPSKPYVMFPNTPYAHLMIPVK